MSKILFTALSAPPLAEAARKALMSWMSGAALLAAERVPTVVGCDEKSGCDL
jgi:hypothetical protein